MPTRPGKPDHRSPATRERDARAAAGEHDAMKKKRSQGRDASPGARRPGHPATPG